MFRLVCILSSSEPAADFYTAEQAFLKEYPDGIHIDVFDPVLLDADEALFEHCLKVTRQCDFVFMRFHGTVTSFKRFADYRASLQGKKYFFFSGMEEEASELAGEMGLYPPEYARINHYYIARGAANIEGMMRYIAVLIARVFTIEEMNVPQPVLSRWDGLHDERFEIADEEAYLREAMQSDRPKIGILVNHYTHAQGDYAAVDALMRAIRGLDAVPITVYSQISPDEEMGYGGIEAALKQYFMDEGGAVIDVLINLTPFSLSVLAAPGNGSAAREDSVFAALDVPVLQGMTTYYNLEQWRTAPAGIPSTSLSYFVFQPEFDGQMIAYPMAYTEERREGDRLIHVSLPLEDGVKRLSRLAANWAKLRHIPFGEKKVAILFHNLPPRNDTIGCASGLDSPESVYRMVCDMKAQGLKLEYDFQNGQEIIQRIIDGVTNDGRWSSEEELLEKSIDTVSEARYLEWYHGFSSKVHTEMERDWGAPVGEYMAIDGKLLIPGILNGNLFIGLQPPRALMEKAEELVHNTDIVVPHQYIAFYRWIEEVFGANAVIHVGTHGTLEWLPGREVGLDSDSYTDIAIGSLPNLYPYCISNPGEGTQAKRRGYCSLIDHMIPSMVESGTYEEMADLDAMMKEFYHFQLADPSRLPEIRERIWKAAVEAELTKDVGLTERDAQEDLDACIDRLHAWVSRIQSTEIADGLHIFGKVPEGERKRNLLKVLVRVKNGEVPSLRDGLCEAFREDLEELLSTPSKLRGDGKTNAMRLEELDELGRRLFERWENSNYDSEEIQGLIDELLPDARGSLQSLRACLRFAADEVLPRLNQTEEELLAVRNGLNGRMVLPGPSGCPTRGNARILPTGRNFYSVDPGAIPTRAAWKVGVQLGDQLLERYRKDEGRLPESIAILVYATEAMRTTGDDIAEIMYLLGLKPVWLGGSDRVIGMEVIPLEELGRPRIDVTLRITGLLRDTFPNLIERIEDAVNLVAALDEPHEMNWVKKHIDLELEELMRAGETREQAFEHASLRIFGCPPGTYGAGVKELVYAKKWNDVTDLGNVFTSWGCHAYGRKYHGEKRPQDFSRRLARTDAAVKNESQIEHDMLGSDDFYNYFGGLIAAITTHSGSQKPSYIPNTANRDHLDILSLHEEASKVMRARVNNPRWIEGLKQHGYKGAQEVSAMVDIVFGWDATTDVIDDWMYKKIADRYAFNAENASWIRSVNLYAMQNIAERLLEAVERGMWNASDEDIEKLRDLYMDVEGDIEGAQDRGL